MGTQASTRFTERHVALMQDGLNKWHRGELPSPDERDHVIDALTALAIPRTEDVDEVADRIATEVYEDAGETLSDLRSVSDYIFRRLAEEGLVAFCPDCGEPLPDEDRAHGLTRCDSCDQQERYDRVSGPDPGRLAKALHEATASNDPDGIAVAENEIVAYLGVDPDDTEQGLTPEAARRVDAFVAEWKDVPLDDDSLDEAAHRSASLPANTVDLRVRLEDGVEADQHLIDSVKDHLLSYTLRNESGRTTPILGVDAPDGEAVDEPPVRVRSRWSGTFGVARRQDDGLWTIIWDDNTRDTDVADIDDPDFVRVPASPTVWAMLQDGGVRSAVAMDERGEVLETVEFLPSGDPDWSEAGIADERGGGGADGYRALVAGLERLEENARLIGFDVKRVPEGS